MAVAVLDALGLQESRCLVQEALDVLVLLRLVALVIDLGVDDLAHQEHHYQLQAEQVALAHLELGWLECQGLDDLGRLLQLS